MCQRCEYPVTVTDAAMHRRLAQQLAFDRRVRSNGGSMGLALKQDFGELHLQAGDRLEPSPQFRAYEHGGAAPYNLRRDRAGRIPPRQARTC